MVLLPVLLVAAVAAVSSAEDAVQGRYFPGLPTPLAPFIDFYETHLDPEEFVVLRGLTGTLAFVTFSCLMLAANMGLLPINPAQIQEEYKYKDEHAPYVLHDDHYGARSINSQPGGAPLAGQLPGCLPLFLCSMELAGWTVPLQTAEVTQNPADSASNVEIRRAEPTVVDPSSAAEVKGHDHAVGDPCRRFKHLCSVTWLKNML